MRKVLNSLWAARRAIAVYCCLLTVGWLAGEYLMNLAIPEMRPMNEPMIHRMVMSALAVFVVAAAIPFVPGAEIGFALLLLFGGQAAPIVYSGMVGALILSYSVARIVPLSELARLSRWLRLERSARFIETLAETPRHRRAEALAEMLTGRTGRALMSNRYVALAALLNLPGNSVLGGGGGLAFLAGVSGLYRFWGYLLAVLVAVAPVPLAFLLMG
ncbi:MAG: hypothetical protein LJE62_02525 [Silicimonas sp.]|nr:hypothetical protein [Silicimonas sp.]